jgi:hypothetical protein
MRPEEAQTLVAALVGAYPRERIDAANVEMYRMMIERLGSEGAARDAIFALIETEPRFPSIAQIREEYRRYVDRYAAPALPEPDISEVERALNLKRIRALQERITREIDPAEPLPEILQGRIPAEREGIER